MEPRTVASCSIGRFKIERASFRLTTGRKAEFSIVEPPLDRAGSPWVAVTAYTRNPFGPTIKVVYPGFMTAEQAAAMSTAISMAIDWLAEQLL